MNSRTATIPRKERRVWYQHVLVRFSFLIISSYSLLYWSITSSETRLPALQIFHYEDLTTELNNNIHQRQLQQTINKYLRTGNNENIINDDIPPQKISSTSSLSSSLQIGQKQQLQHRQHNNKNVTTVAIIGCGPAGMSFLHALEYQRRKLEKAGKIEEIRKLPKAICLERQSSHGGIWNAGRSFQQSSSNVEHEVIKKGSHRQKGKEKEKTTNVTTNMYEALWTNSPKTDIEYFDYTFDEHFNGRPLPVYMPRQPILEYMTSRVTKHCPNFFDKYAKFNTEVTNVIYNKKTSKFTVTTTDLETNEEIVGLYDKVIWAAGVNRIPNMPPTLVKPFIEHNFKGVVIHSSDTKNLENDVKGKNILLIGGAYSAEDIAFTAIKLGVNKVYITHRKEAHYVSLHQRWPMDKVALLPGMTSIDVHDSSRSVQVSTTTNTMSNNGTNQEHNKTTTLHNISTVVFCTGYQSNYDMLDHSLYGYPREDNWWYKESVLMSNPSMLRINGDDTEYILLMVDIRAWYVLSIILGKTKIPTKDEIKQEEESDELLYSFEDDWICKALMKQKNSLVIDMYEKYCEYALNYNNPGYELDWSIADFHAISRLARSASYPVDFGTYHNVTENGIKVNITEHSIKILESYYGTVYHRLNVTNNYDNSDDGNPSSNSTPFRWTFRDYNNGNEFVSLFTGSKSCNMKQKWLDIDPHVINDPSMLCM